MAETPPSDPGNSAAAAPSPPIPFELIQSVFDTSPYCITIAQGKRLAYANAAFLAVTGYTWEEFRELEFFEVFHPEARELFARQVMARQKGEAVPSRFHIPIIRKDGSKRWLDASSNILRKGDQIIGVLAMAVDITENLNMVENLRREERRLRDVFHSMQDGLMILDRGMNILDANETMRRWFPRQSHSIVGRKCHQVLHIRNKPCAFCPMPDVLKKGTRQSEHIAELPHCVARGPFQYILHPLKDAAGEMVGAVAMLQELKKGDDQLGPLKEDADSFPSRVLRLLYEGAVDSLEHALLCLMRESGADRLRLLLFEEKGKIRQVLFLKSRTEIPDMPPIPAPDEKKPWPSALLRPTTPIVIDDAEASPPKDHDEAALLGYPHACSVLAAPVRGKEGEVAGLLQLDKTDQPVPWTPEQILLMETLGRLLVQFIKPSPKRKR
jgi:PAS domain S-box-containing protein